MSKHFPHKGLVRAVFRFYLREVFKQPWLFTIFISGITLIQVMDLIAPLYLRQFFNQLSIGSRDAAAVAELLSILTMFAAVLFGRWFFNRVEHICNLHFQSRAMSNLFSVAFEYLIGHSHHFFISQFVGTLTRRVSKFVYAFETIFDTVTITFYPAILFVAGVTVIIFFRNHLLGILLGGWVILFVAFQMFVSLKIHQPLRVARTAEDSRVIGNLSDALANHDTIVLFSGASHEFKRLRDNLDRWYKATIRSWRVDWFIWTALGLLFVVINVSLLYGGVILWKDGAVSIGDFILIQVYLFGISERLMGINRDMKRFNDSLADASEMAEILETPHDIRDVPAAQPLVVRNGEIIFDHIDFYFHSTNAVLKDFYFDVKSREKLALVGPSGAGKSTITKLLLRLYDVAKGSIEIDGQNISKVTQESLRNAIAFVPQEPVLFHRTLKENIRYGRRSASDAEVIEAAKKAHCHEFISGLPAGYETYVGERGIKLSGGERQRVAIARAILEDAPILVLDEATSSLDSESEALIQDALQTLMSGKTVIVIAHRLSTIMKMDRIVVLENGKVVAEGTHEELLKAGGLYQKLWSIQAGGFLPHGELEFGGMDEADGANDGGSEEPAGNG